MNPLVTVLIPTRNRHKQLHRTLDSLLSLETPLNIIVVDDHSLDKTPELLEKWSKLYCIRYIRYPSQERRSYHRVPMLLNLGNKISQETGYYMISGDDMTYSKSYIKKLIEHMKKDNMDIASGYSIQYGYNERTARDAAPGGSGRLFTHMAWRSLTPFKTNIGWEAGVLYEARRKNYSYKQYPIPKSHLCKQTQSSTWTFGQAAHVLGTPLIYTVFRAAKSMVKGIHPPRNALSLVLGQIEYILRREPKNSEISHYVSTLNKQQLISYINKAIYGTPVFHPHKNFNGGAPIGK